MTHRCKAFTLIELLVVISIIAVLMAILMPALQRVKDQAREQACTANLKSIGLGVQMYLQDSDFVLPDLHTHSAPTNGHLWFDDAGNPLTLEDNDSYWGIAYIDYLDERKVFGCPAFANWCDVIAEDMLYGDDPDLIRTSAYGANGWLTKENTTRIRRQSETIFAHDHMEPRIENGDDMLFASGATNLAQYREGGGRANWYRGIFRHGVRASDKFETGGSLNILWLDAHVSPLKETTGQDVLKRWYDPLGKN